MLSIARESKREKYVANLRDIVYQSQLQITWVVFLSIPYALTLNHGVRFLDVWILIVKKVILIHVYYKLSTVLYRFIVILQYTLENGFSDYANKFVSFTCSFHLTIVLILPKTRYIVL